MSMKKSEDGMSPTDEERLSAFMDGELDVADIDTLLDSVQGENELSARWQRYQSISELMQGHQTRIGSDSGVLMGIREAIQDEPAPPRDELAERRAKTGSPVLKQVLGMAVAASVTAVAILGIQSRVESPDAPAVTIAEAQPQTISKPVVDPDALMLAASVEPPEAPPVTEEQIWNRALPSTYLVNHSELAASSSMQGVVPHVRFVAHEVNP